MPNYKLYDGESIKAVDDVYYGAGATLESIFGVDPRANITRPVAWNSVGYVYRCVELRANAISDLPWIVSRGDREVANQDDYESIPFLSNFNKLLFFSEAALCIVAEAYLYKVRTRRREPTELQWFAPGTMTPKWTRDGLAYFERRANNQTLRVPVDDVVYMRQPNPLHETNPGPSPVGAALADAGVIYDLNEFATSFFKRGAIRATMLNVDGVPTPEEKSRLKSWWERVFSGKSNAFGAEVFSNGQVTPVVVGDGVGDLNNSELTGDKREAIASALGVPHSLLMSNAANYATAESDRLSFYDFTVNPQARHIQTVLNQYLFEPLGYTFAFVPDSLPVYRENENERSSAFATYVNAGLPRSVAAELLQIPLPDGMGYDSLDPDPLPTPPQLDANERAAEVRRFKEWYQRRGKPDPERFSSNILTPEDKRAIIATIAEDADSANAFFPVALDYP